ncbi:MAG: hypothetical protein IJJ45_03560 [Clostridia bacterium]|nr:hypothetical protein [Clostridia bacterium]MBQ6373542.1 hypothetical protein [Clostridia bacterium]
MSVIEAPASGRQRNGPFAYKTVRYLADLKRTVPEQIFRAACADRRKAMQRIIGRSEASAGRKPTHTANK